MLDIVKKGPDREWQGAMSTPPLPCFQPLAHINHESWQALCRQACEPNAYYLPDWARAVSASARGRTDGDAILSYSARELAGLLPVVSCWRAYHFPLPAFVSFDPYGALGTPLLAGSDPVAAAQNLMQEARNRGARSLILRDVPLDGAAIQAFSGALAANGQLLHILSEHRRAVLDATKDAEALLRDALGAKKLKELRRQRARMQDFGAVEFRVARTPDEIARALNDFLLLEASGWKAARGTALMQHAGDDAFIRFATQALAANGACEIVTLTCGQIPVASGIVLRHQDRAFWFKIGADPAFARFSPGVQLALELTKHLCADPAIRLADSTAIPNHPMIDPVWRGRMRVGDVVIPLYRRDPIHLAIVVALKARHHARHAMRPLARILRQVSSIKAGKVSS